MRKTFPGREKWNDHHPNDSESEEKLKEISEAYAVLSDPEKRRQYDFSGHVRFKSRYASEDIFIYDLPITQMEADWGTEKEVLIRTIGEEKRLLIQIPRGVGPGTLLRVVLNLNPA